RLLDAHFKLVHYPFGEAIFAIGVNNPLKVAGFDPALTGWFYPARDIWSSEPLPTVIANSKFSSCTGQIDTSKPQFPGSRSALSGHRYYSPSLGRFIYRDPIEEQGGINLYSFVGNNAVNAWDYLGMDSFGSTHWDAYGNAYWVEEDGMTGEDFHDASVNAANHQNWMSYAEGAIAGQMATVSQIALNKIQAAIDNGSITVGADGKVDMQGSTNTSLVGALAWFGAGPNATRSNTAITGGSKLGNAIQENLPLVGPMLGRVGDLVSGIFTTVGGMLTANANTMRSGVSQIGYGAAGLFQIGAIDFAGGVMGIVSKPYTVGLAIRDAVKNEDDAIGRNLIGLPQQAIPNLLAFGGPKWGSEQYRDTKDALTYSDWGHGMHDLEFGNKDGANGANMRWVQRQWSPVPADKIGSGPLGIAYVLLGTLPFAAADGFQLPKG
ncbi:MAG: hypothetical protein K9M98_13100, partial [Cephaloticoccus sp.]|nr:hypothetical protein [Cephaloticoccus sp.]